MKMRSTNSMNQQKVDDELKKLALSYIKAHNEKRFTDAELILHDLEKFKELTSKHNDKDTT